MTSENKAVAAANPPAATPASPPAEVISLSDFQALKVEKIALLSERDSLKSSLESSVSKYKTLILAANPGIPPELIPGNTIEEMDNSLIKAKELVEKIRKNGGPIVIPAGSPPRSGPDINSLSASEKIKLGLKQ